MKLKIATLMLLLFVLAGCSAGNSIELVEGSGDSSLVVKASFYPLAHFTEQVIGDLGVVESLTPTGAEPHSFEPSAKAIASIYDADLFLFNGAMLDPWAEDISHDLEYEGVTIVKMSSHFNLNATQEEHHDDHDDDHDEEHQHGEFDPHIWLDPVFVQDQVGIIRDNLVEIDPDNEAAYRSNASAYISELQALDFEFRNQLSSCSQDMIIVGHDAFGYLGSRYDFEILAIAGISPDEEPSLKNMAELIDLAREHDIYTIFFEELASPKLSETIANEIGGGTLVLNPLEGLTDDQLSFGETYLSIMRQNLENLSLALECQ